jgi:serine protease Do
VGVRAKVAQDADEEESPPGRREPSNRSDLPKGGPGMPQPNIATTQGSGFFISSDGYAMTTNHLVERSEKIEVTTDDGTVYAAKLVGADPKTDLALLKIEGEKKFPAAQIADKEPRIGEWVLAVGNSFGLGGTVTAGIVSACAAEHPWSLQRLHSNRCTGQSGQFRWTDLRCQRQCDWHQQCNPFADRWLGRRWLCH